MTAERGFNPEKIGAKIIKFPKTEKEKEIERSREILRCDKRIDDLELDIINARKRQNPEKSWEEIRKAREVEKEKELSLYSQKKVESEVGPQTKIEKQPVLSDEERQQVLAEIFEIDKALAELEFDVRLLGEEIGR